MPIWNIPFARNPFFTGREDLLEHLHTQLQTTQVTAISQSQAISGLGGIGKTQLAIEYAYRYRQEYRAVLWARADTTEVLNASYAEIARLLNLPQQDAQEQEVIVQAVKAWLSSQPGWLLILDNADELNIVQAFLPTECPGHLLLTTRAQAMGKLARRLEVETLDPEVGTLLLLRRAGLIAVDALLETASASDQSIVLALTEKLGGLPLALDQAGAYIEETQCSVADYHQQYQTRRAELLAHRGRLVDDHPEPVATTWSLSFAKVEQANPTAVELLRICAFLAPDAIPEELLVEALKTPFPSSETPGQRRRRGGWFSRLTFGRRKKPTLPAEKGGTIDEAVAFLRAYSLIQRNGTEKTLSVHRLVQAVVRDSLPTKIQQQWIQRAVQAVAAVFPDIEFANWPMCERLLSHALVCATWIEHVPLVAPTAAGLLNKIGLYLKQRARYREAEPLYERTLATRERELGASHPDTATSLNNLARLYTDQGKYAEAEPLFQRALRINEQGLGAEHPSTAMSLNHLALVYTRQGRYEEAEPLLQRALAISEQQLEREHPSIATILDNLGSLYVRQGRYEEAEPLRMRALTIREQQLGAGHPDTAMGLDNLALVYARQGRYEEAELLYQRALAIWEQQLGVMHPDTAISLNNLASLYQAQGKHAEAEPLYERALRINEQELGTNHPATASSLNNLASLYQAQGRYGEAKPLLQRALTIREQALGSEHPDTAMSVWWLAALSEQQQHYQVAKPLYERALSTSERTVGSEHPNTQGIRKQYAALLEKMKGEEAAQ